MPPKKEASKKTTEKVKAKIVEDKTFGLKNKKGAKQQKFIQQVQKQVTNKLAQKNPRDLLDPNQEREKKKEEEKKKKEELTALFKPVLQTVAKGVDPKSVVCVYFKQGICQKGDKCKFSHDLSKERKSEKRNIYEDTREEKETMENWDEEKLEDVVNQKHGEENKKKNQTQIVCKYFIEAVENKTYGWFWCCPNGENCMYRHALPPGFTLKSEMKKKSEEEEISLEMLIEKERAGLGPKVTKVTLESFLAWKKRKLEEKKDERKKQDDKKRADYKLGFVNGLTGRDLFTFDPTLISVDDDGAENDIDYRQRADVEEETTQQEIRDIKGDFFSTMAREADNTGTIATEDRFSYLESMWKQENDKVTQRRLEREQAEAEEAAANAQNDEDDEDGDDDDEDDDGENEDGGSDKENEDEETDDVEEFKNSMRKLEKKPQTSQQLNIDESLFKLEDLPDLDDELEKLEIE